MLEKVIKLFFNTRGTKRTLWVLNMLMFQLVKIKFHILKSMVVEMISWTIYFSMNNQFLVTNYLLDNVFK
jgi:hypothetical protein